MSFHCIGLRRAAVTALPLGLLLAAGIVAKPGRSAERNEKSTAGEQVVQLLDGYVQKRFERDNGQFGITRLVPPVTGHEAIHYQLQADDSGEKEVLHAIAESGYEYLVEFVHCSHVPGTKQPSPTALPAQVQVRGMSLIAAKSTATPFQPYLFTKEHEEFRKTIEDPIKKAAGSAVERLVKGKGVETTVGTWQVSFRPVRASSKACLNCHVGAKSGDLLGVMAYAIRQPIKSASTASASK